MCEVFVPVFSYFGHFSGEISIPIRHVSEVGNKQYLLEKYSEVMGHSGARWEQGYSFLYFGSVGDTGGSNAGAIQPSGDFVLDFDEETGSVMAIFEGWSAIKNIMGSNSGTDWNAAYEPWV